MYPKIKIGFASKPHLNDVYVEPFNDKTFNLDVNESGVIKLKYYNSSNPIFQHLPVREKVKKIEVKRMRKSSIEDTLTTIDNCEILKMGGKVIEIYEGFIYRENFETSPFRKVIEKMFTLGQNYTDEKKVFNAKVK